MRERCCSTDHARVIASGSQLLLLQPQLLRILLLRPILRRAPLLVQLSVLLLSYDNALLELLPVLGVTLLLFADPLLLFCLRNGRLSAMPFPLTFLLPLTFLRLRHAACANHKKQQCRAGNSCLFHW